MLIYILTGVLIFLILVIIYLVYLREVDRKRHLQIVRELEKTIKMVKDNHEQNVLHDAVVLFEREMQQMGADIHDDLVQRLAGFRLFIDRLERAESQSEVHAILIKMNGEFKNVVESVRRISQRLLPAEAETGSLNTSVQELCHRIGTGRLAHIHFTSDGKERILLREHQQHLYRIVQELINNIIKHTAAWHIWVKIHWQKDRLEIEVEDDGLHYKELVNAITQQSNKGFLTLHKRASLIGAKVSYKPVERGTKALVEFEY